jgi:hypothetical protein
MHACMHFSLSSDYLSQIDEIQKYVNVFYDGLDRCNLGEEKKSEGEKKKKKISNEWTC